MLDFFYQVRAEVSILHRLHHPHVIEFVGVVLHPLCFILEWAPSKSLHSVLQKYRKMDARISPKALQKTAHQVSTIIVEIINVKEASCSKHRTTCCMLVFMVLDYVRVPACSVLLAPCWYSWYLTTCWYDCMLCWFSTARSLLVLLRKVTSLEEPGTLKYAILTPYPYCVLNNMKVTFE